MGLLYNRFKELKNTASNTGIFDKVGLVTFKENEKQYEIYFTRRRANKYSIIHCKNKSIEWEQFPILPRLIGRYYGKHEPLIFLEPSKNAIRIFVVRGKPNGFVGLDDGNFRSVHKFDEAYLNVMSEKRFKEL